MPFNLLDYSALVIPVSKVDPKIDVVKAPHEFYNEMDKANYELCEFCLVVHSHILLIKQYVDDDPSNFANAPISVQLVGQVLEEEAVIAMGKIVDDALKAHTLQH